jgi:hypothetical protein
VKVKPLVEAILAASAFLEEGSDDDVDPDWAVKTLESMAYHVGQVPEAEVPGEVEAHANVTSLVPRHGTVSILPRLPG